MEIPTNLGKIVGINKDGQCWDIGFGSFASLFPRLRDNYETILLNSRIPEPANIEFYGKCLSGEDFCNFCDPKTPGRHEDQLFGSTPRRPWELRITTI